jgi:hypothetical protein
MHANEKDLVMVSFPLSPLPASIELPSLRPAQMLAQKLQMQSDPKARPWHPTDHQAERLFFVLLAISSSRARWTMRNASVFLLLLGTLTVVGAASSPQASEAQDEQELRQIEATTAKGEQQNDVSMMRLFASDFVSSGRNVMSKQQLEEAVKSNFVSHRNGPSPVTIEKKNMMIYLFGDTAVVTYIKEYRQTRDTTKFFDEDDTDVFKRGTKGWLLQFSKLSPVANTAVS